LLSVSKLSVFSVETGFLKVDCTFRFPNNNIGARWISFLICNDPAIKITKQARLCLLHFHISDHLPGSKLKSTAIPRLYGAPSKLYSIFKNVKHKKASNGPKSRHKNDTKHLLAELRQELSNASCHDCERCAKIFAEAIQHLKGHRTVEKPLSPIVASTREIVDEEPQRQEITLFVKSQGTARLYKCPCCLAETTYPDIITHIRSHEQPVAGSKRKRLADATDVTESIDLIDDSDDESTEKSSEVLAQMHFRAKKQGSTTVYVCNICSVEIADDIVSHYAMHQVEDELPQEPETLTDSSDDEEEEELA
jgi:hypothetical protein